jgi:hypothetical protein
MPAADSRPTVRMDRSILSHDAVTCGGSPEVSSTAFRAQPPDLPPVPLMEMGFAVTCQLARHRRPLHPVLVHRLALLLRASFRPRLATTPLRFAMTSPPSGCQRDFHPQAVEHVRHTRKKAAFSRGLLELCPHSRCPVYFLGASLALGVVALGVVLAGDLGAVGLPAPEAVGAGTPDWAL